MKQFTEEQYQKLVTTVEQMQKLLDSGVHFDALSVSLRAQVEVLTATLAAAQTELVPLNFDDNESSFIGEIAAMHSVIGGDWNDGIGGLPLDANPNQDQPP